LETRNLIKFGKNSYVLTLPSAWIKKNKLEKGDSIFVTPTSNNLLISPSSSQKEEEEKTSIVHTDGKEIATVFREIITAYVNNSKIIEVKGEKLRTGSEKIVDFLQSLMSLEILEQTSDRIVVRDFLRFNDISISTIIKRVDNILRVMLKDCFGSFDEDYSESLIQRDKSINRFYFLLYRLIKSEFNNPRSHRESISLLTNFLIIESLEEIGDECKRMAWEIRLLKPKAKQKELIMEFLNKLDSVYRDSMKSLYNKDKNLADKASNNIRICLDQLGEYTDKEKNYNMVKLYYSFRTFLVSSRNIARVTLHNT
jgi:phosphate uptake regulator